MGKTFKDQQKWGKKKFPRVPPIVKRSEPFEDRRRKKEKYPEEWREEIDFGDDGGDDPWG